MRFKGHVERRICAYFYTKVHNKQITIAARAVLDKRAQTTKQLLHINRNFKHSKYPLKICTAFISLLKYCVATEGRMIKMYGRQRDILVFFFL